MKPSHSILCITLCSLLLIACGGMSSSEQQATTTTATAEPQLDTGSGDDATLAGARGLFDIAINDSVDAPAGDNTDYKYFDVTERGRVTVRVRFTAPEVGGTVSLHNDFGDTLYEEPVAPGQNEVVIQEFSVLPGRYYVRIFASEGSSEYIVGRDFESAVAVVVPTGPTPEELAAQEAAERAERERRSSRRSRRRTESTESTPTPRSEPTEEPTVAVEAPVVEEPAVEEEPPIRATILTIRERSGGQGSILILLGCGSSSGLSEGSSGRVGSSGERARITRITGSDSCEAESDASVSQIGSASYVNFTR
ncbi:MAG: hypothetical protein JW797_19400 [Bradymonadales bacterium]|nr:hypothetical protein [Bradymonadales bacterium]